MRNIILALLIGAGAASAQALSVGVIGGAPFTDVVKATSLGALNSVANSDKFTIGPVLQVNLPASFRLEVDALYRPYGFTLLGGDGFSTNISAQQWRFPVLLQYRFKAPIVGPFLEAGLSFNHLSGISSAAKDVIASGPGQLLHQSDAGIVLGAGVDVKLPFVRISGELRYTRQTVSNFADLSQLNQAEALVGIHF